MWREDLPERAANLSLGIKRREDLGEKGPFQERN